MSTTPSTTPSTTESTTTESTTVEYEKGTWQAAIQRATLLSKKGEDYKKKATTLLWQGATAALAEREDERADTDASGEALRADLLAIMGTSRKGDVSKIVTVAIAVKRHGLVTANYPSLSKAYAEARRLTQTIKAQKAEDVAIDKAIEALSENVPSSTTTVEGAALILLSKGVDGLVVAVLDALGKNNEAAHKALLRSFSVEIAARVQAAKPKPAPRKTAAPKDGATKAKPATKKATAKPAAKKATAKPAAKKATPVKATAKPKPVSASKGDPNKRALPKPVAVKA